MTYYPPYDNSRNPSFPTTNYPLSSDFMPRDPPSAAHSPFEASYNTLSDMERRLASLEKRMAELEGATAEHSEHTSIPPAGISKEKMATINMIISNKSIGWKAALRKILVAVFGVGTLAQSCAVGKKNANNKCLNGQALDSIKGMIMHLLILLYFNNVNFCLQRYCLRPLAMWGT